MSSGRSFSRGSPGGRGMGRDGARGFGRGGRGGRGMDEGPPAEIVGSIPYCLCLSVHCMY